MSIERVPGLRFLNSGFTLVELLVSISIMAIVLGITMSGGPQAIMRTTLADNAYQAELLIRQVQLEGSAINSLGNNFGGAGVFFNLSTSTQVLKFKDRIDPTIKRAIGVGNGLYDQSPVDEQLSVLKTINQHHIGQLCVASGVSPLLCNNAIVPPIKTLTISFTRPKQAAHIYVNGTSSVDYDVACIQFDSIQSPAKGYVRSILVYKSGMITKKVDTCN